MTARTFISRVAAAWLLSGAALLVGVTVVVAQQPAAPPAPAPGTVVSAYTAVSANVAEPGSPVQIRLFRWSTDQERTPLVTALNPPPPAPAQAAEGGAAARGARAGGGGGGGRGGGRGRGRGGAAAAPVSPTAALTAAISRAPTIGYIWTTDVTGYAIKYAVRTPLPGGGERVILATDRRLGMHAAAWQPVTSAAPTDYEFTLIEMRIDPKGAGEARTSLTSKVVVDKEAGTVALEDYAAAPAILQKVKPAGHGG